VVCVYPELFDVLTLAQKINCGLRILKCVVKRESASAAPRAALERDQHVPARSPNGICEIKILFIAGKTMQH